MTDKRKERTEQSRHTHPSTDYTPALEMMQEGSQKYNILMHLIEHGSITPKEAERKPIYSMRLSARIYELKHDHKIPVEKEIVYEKRGKKSIPHARYYIKEESDV